MVRLTLLICMVLAAALYRILPHPYNFSPLAAVALFSGAYFSSSIAAFAVPLITIWISDLILNNIILKAYFHEFTLFYEGWFWQYGSFIIITLIGCLIKNKVKISNIIIASLSSSVLFFLITNFGVWFSFKTYPHTIEGLVACYIAGIPYFSHTLFGDLIFCTILFGSFELLQRQYGVLKPVRSNE